MSGLLLQKTEIVAIQDETSRVRSFTLRHAKKSELPQFTAGAHVAVETPKGLLRHYSLCSDPADRRTYRIAVLREDAGQGGSQSMHTSLAVGDFLYVTRPRNYFALEHARDPLLLLAGGIGITPLLAMVFELERHKAAYELNYCARSRSDAAFIDELERHCVHGRLRLHFDDGIPGAGLDIAALLRAREGEAAVYACGPKAFLDTVIEASGHWPAHKVRFERFTALPAEQRGSGEAFELVVSSTGQTIQVGAGQTAAAALREAGHNIRTDCEGGICGTCRVGVLEGTILHRDAVLKSSERHNTMTVCVSRAQGRLVLAL